MDRPRLVRRGLVLNWITIGYNVLEAGASIVLGWLAGSVALLGFGLDSVIEVTASAAAQWRLRADRDPVRRARVERLAHRITGASFLALAAWIVWESGGSLLRHEAPERSPAGIAVLLLSVIIMPVLARAKRQVALALASGALRREARQTSLCAYLSAIALVGVALNGFAGWWWADPAAALAMVPIIAKEGLEGLGA